MNPLKSITVSKHWMKVALLNFVLAALAGALLRYAFVIEISWIKFKNVLHAHSHTAMLGWIYLGLFALILNSFTGEAPRLYKKYERLFWITELTVLGMFFTFPIFGYSTIPIIFSTLHVICSYLFAYWIWKERKVFKSAVGPSVKFLGFALISLVLSTLSLWAMIPIMIFELRGTTFYYMTVQFYLHFQFNGWFIFGVLALFFRWLESTKVSISDVLVQRFFWLLVGSCLLTYALAVAWSNPVPLVFFINGIGVIIQLLALVAFFYLLRPVLSPFIKSLTKMEKTLLLIAGGSFVLKILVQTAVVIPFIAEVAYTIRNYVIGFIHLILLGLVTSFIIACGKRRGLIYLNGSTGKVGLIFMFAGIFFSELLLFIQGTMFWGALGFLPYYYELLFIVSVFIPIGVLMLLINQFWSKKRKEFRVLA